MRVVDRFPPAPRRARVPGPTLRFRVLRHRVAGNFLKRLVVTRCLTASVSVLLGLASFSPVLFLARPRPTISVVFVPTAIVFSVATNTIFRITMCHLGSTKSLDSFVPNRDPTVLGILECRLLSWSHRAPPYS